MEEWFIEEKINISHKEQINSIRYKYGHDTSSHSFQILYIWRRLVGELLHMEKDMYTVQYSLMGEHAWLFPCGNKESIYRFINSHIDEPDFQLYFLRDKDVEFLKEFFPERFRIEEANEDSEYIVNRKEHVELAGHKYAKLRTNIHKGDKEYDIKVVPLTLENAKMAAELTRQWVGGKETEGILHIHGNEVDENSLKMIKELELTGIVMFVDGRPYGVAAGFPLSEETFDMYLCKENSLEMGLGYYIKREMIKYIPEKYTYVNIEEDLGIAGLRTMKTIMKPVKMNTMWKAYNDKK